MTDRSIALPADSDECATAVPRTTVVRRTLGGQAGPAYYLCVPEVIRRPAPFVSVHGISRNAREHARLFAPFAARYGVVLVAPLYPKEHFPDYQRLGSGTGLRADVVLDGILAEVRGVLRLPGERCWLFGYSGGGQFVHRYTLAHPQRVAGAVVAAAGWYTFPDPALAYPLGIGAAAVYGERHFDPGRFLQVPFHVMVGARDCQRDAELRKSLAVDRLQGRTRLERARRWVDAMAEAAWRRGLPSRCRFDVLPHCGHSFVESMRRGGMGCRVFASLFGAPPPCSVRANGNGAGAKVGT